MAPVTETDMRRIEQALFRAETRIGDVEQRLAAISALQSLAPWALATLIALASVLVAIFR